MSPTGGFVGYGPVLAGAVEVEVHLPGVSVRELSELQIDHDETAQAPVEEEQIHAVPRCADAEPALAANEREVAAEFEEERLEVSNERFLDIGFRILVLEAEEFEHVGILDLLLGRYRVIGLGYGTLRSIAASSRESAIRS